MADETILEFDAQVCYFMGKIHLVDGLSK